MPWAKSGLQIERTIKSLRIKQKIVEQPNLPQDRDKEMSLYVHVWHCE